MKLYCRCGHVHRTEGFQPEPGEHICERCQGWMGTFKPRTEPPERKPRKRIRRSQPERDWTRARKKVEKEAVCRVCGSPESLQAAHVVGREHDLRMPDGRLIVRPQSIVPLCPHCHQRYDGQAQPPLDLLPHLTLLEQLRAVRDAGGIVTAYRRTTNDRHIGTEAA